MAANCLQRRACDGRPIADDQSVEQYDQAQVDADRQLPTQSCPSVGYRIGCILWFLAP